MDKIDFKKREQVFYNPKKVSIVEIPSMQFLAIRGVGDPNTSAAFKQAITTLYAVAYKIAMAWRKGYEIPNFYPYVMPPLEGLWTSTTKPDGDLDKAQLVWQIMLRQPEFVDDTVLAWAKTQVDRELALDAIELIEQTDGLVVQAPHRGSFDTEQATFTEMETFALAQGYRPVMHQYHHREIYLSDARKTSPENQRVVLRLFIEKV